MRRRTRTLLTLASLTALAAPTPALAQSPQLTAAIDSIVNAELTPGKAPGITIGVVQGTDTLALKGYGLADVENNVPVTDRSIFRIGSVTKQFTAAAVMKLVDEGQIRLDATVADYLPDYSGPGRAVTITQLLNHTSGIPSYTSLGPRFWDQSRLDLTHAQMRAMFEDDSLDFAPGTRWSYNNSAYFLLGVILEEVTGKDYDDLVAETQFAPLGLTGTSYCRQREIIPHRAMGYDYDDGELINAAPLSMNAPGAAGALCSTPRDLIRWTDALVNGRVVSADSYGRMTTPLPLPSGAPQTYGFGLSRGELGEHEVIMHGGGINGFTAFLAHYPASDLTIAIIANGPTNAGDVHAAIARRVLGVPEPKVAEELDLETTAEERARYVGNYDLAPAAPMQVRVFEQGDRLFAQATGQGAFPLRYQGEHTFIGPTAVGITMVFTMDGDTATSFLLKQGGAEIQAPRIP